MCSVLKLWSFPGGPHEHTLRWNPVKRPFACQRYLFRMFSNIYARWKRLPKACLYCLIFIYISFGDEKKNAQKLQLMPLWYFGSALFKRSKRHKKNRSVGRCQKSVCFKGRISFKFLVAWFIIPHAISCGGYNDFGPSINLDVGFSFVSATMNPLDKISWNFIVTQQSLGHPRVCTPIKSMGKHYDLTWN